MASIMDSVVAASTEVPRKRKSSPEFPSSDAAIPSSDGSFFSASRKRYGMEEDEDLWAMKKPRVSDVTAVPDENYQFNHNDMDVDDVVVKAEPKDLDAEEDEEDVQIKVRDSKPLVASTKINRRVVNSSSVKHTVAKPEPVVAKADVEVKPRPVMPNGKPLAAGAAHWSSVQETLVPQKASELDEVKAAVGLVKADNVLEADGGLRMFWLDFMEQDGVVHLVGKVLDRQSGKYVSACVSVNGIKRNLFVKPRAKRFCEFPSHRSATDATAAGFETDIEVTKTDVFQDFDTVRRKAGIEEWASKFVNRKYAFEDQTVEKGESEWLKVVYGFDRELHPLF
jgi:DNA polymerase alpha subunit A